MKFLEEVRFISGGFGPVVPDGLGVGYAAQNDYMACAITARKSTMKCSPSDGLVLFIAQLTGYRLSDVY